jgi:hypothetical protein
MPLLLTVSAATDVARIRENFILVYLFARRRVKEKNRVVASTFNASVPQARASGRRQMLIDDCAPH